MDPVNAVFAARAAPSSTDTTPAKKTTTPEKASSFKDALDKETRLQHVKDHRYAKVMDGDAQGMYVNRSGNDRNGDLFTKVQRDGRTFHVYGEGKDRMVFETTPMARREELREAAKAKKTAPAASGGAEATPPTGTTKTTGAKPADETAKTDAPRAPAAGTGDETPSATAG